MVSNYVLANLCFTLLTLNFKQPENLGNQFVCFKLRALITFVVNLIWQPFIIVKLNKYQLNTKFITYSQLNTFPFGFKTVIIYVFIYKWYTVYV